MYKFLLEAQLLQNSSAGHLWQLVDGLLVSAGGWTGCCAPDCTWSHALGLHQPNLGFMGRRQPYIYALGAYVHNASPHQV